jgi:flagellar protein FlgJ
MTDTIPGTIPAAIPPADTAAPLDPKIWQAAKKFEAMAIGQLLAPMFDTADVAHSSVGGGDAEAAWQPMMIDAIGKQIEAHGGFGLAQPVYAAMLRAQEGGAHAAGLPKGGVHQAGVPKAGAQEGGVPNAGMQEGGAGLPAPRQGAHQPRKST